MKVLVTGSTGYVGHQLALELASKGYQVHAFVRNLKSESIPKHNNIKLFQGDVCDVASIEKAIKNCDMVFHAAAFTNLKYSKIDNFYNINVRGTQNLLEAALKHKVKRFIYTSTLSVYGPSYKNVSINESQPRLTSYMNDYELTKGMSEEIVLDFVKKGLTCIILNVSRVYGPGLTTYSNGINKLVLMIQKKDYLFVPSKLNSIANYVYIKDVVNAHVLAIGNGKNGEKYIIGGENLTYNGLFKIIIQLTKSKIKIVKIHFGFLRVCLFIVNGFKKILGLQSALTPKVLDALFTNRKATSQKAEFQLHYKATPLLKGLENTVKFYIIK
jgi:nucleoside-diphosphate-sugar epimerase